MRKVISTVFLMFCFLKAGTMTEAKSFKPFYGKNRTSANEILKRVAGKLGALKVLKYHYQRELNYLSEGYHQESAAESYFDFTSPDKTLGLRYQFKTDDFLLVYNGSEKFSCDLKKKTITIVSNPAKDSFNSNSYFYNSLLTLKNALPFIIADGEIPKTLISDEKKQNFYEVEFSLASKTLDGLGNFSPITLKRQIIYRLKIDKKTFLPMQILQKNSANDDYTKTVFSRLETDAAPQPTELSWYYSSYLKDFKKNDSSSANAGIIRSGETAPNWSLPQFGAGTTGKSISLNDFAGETVMLEFWISYCGYCIAAVPRLNALAGKYQNKNFRLFAVNVHDSAEVIALFKKNYKPDYDLLFSGEKISQLYGVEVFPTVVLIDKTGKIIYAGVFNEKVLDELIQKNI